MNKRTNKKLSAWSLTLLLPMALSSFALPGVSHAAFGHAEGNGGDGVYVDGKLVLRDFLRANSQNGTLSQITDKKEFLENTPDFMPLLREISDADPYLALAIWGQLNHARIWVTQGTLPLLPEAVTGVVGPKADVQIAIREMDDTSDDIVISLPAFNQVAQSYVLVHEALHGLVDGSGPMHHERVRAIVRYLHDHRGNYDSKALEQVLEANGGDNQNYISYSDKTLETEVNNSLRIFIQNRGSDSALCLLKQELNPTLELDMDAKEAMDELGPDCRTNGDIALELSSLDPVIGKYIQKAMNGVPQDYSYFNEITWSPGWWARNFDEVQMKGFKNECREYASPGSPYSPQNREANIRSFLSIAKKAKAEKERLLKINPDDSRDPAEIQALRLAAVELRQVLWNGSTKYVQLPEIDQAIAGANSLLNGSIAADKLVFQKNEQRCIDVLGKDYLKN